MNHDDIPGVIIPPPAGPLTKSLTYKGRTYSYRCEAGFPLTFANLGAIPKKVLKVASKEWRKVNPPLNETIWPLSVLRCSYHARVLLRPWLEEKAAVEVPA